MTLLARPRGPLVLAVLGLLLSTGLAFAAPKFPPLSGRVVDSANLLSPQAEAQLTAELEGLETRTGRQLVVATIPDLQGYEIEDYGYQLGRAWGIGDKDRDDGALLLVAPQDRKVRIEVGYGLEPVLTDALSSVIIQERILPAFREGRMEAGVISGTQAIVQQLSLPDSEAKAVVAAAKPVERSGASIGPPLILILFIAFWLLGGILKGFGRRRGRAGGGMWWLLPLILSSSGRGGGGRGGWRGGFSGGGGSFGGGGSSGGW
jgi:uncharacterized protein